MLVYMGFNSALMLTVVKEMVKPYKKINIIY